MRKARLGRTALAWSALALGLVAAACSAGASASGGASGSGGTVAGASSTGGGAQSVGGGLLGVSGAPAPGGGGGSTSNDAGAPNGAGGNASGGAPPMSGAGAGGAGGVGGAAGMRGGGTGGAGGGSEISPPSDRTSPKGSIVVYSGTNTGPIKYGGIGWLYGLSETNTISDAMISGLVHPGYTGQKAPGGAQHPDGDALKVAPQFKRTGGLGVSIYVQDYYPDWPYKNVGVDSYMANVIDKVTASVKGDVNRSFVSYVPFNEPDWIWYAPSGSLLTKFFGDWQKVYARIKAGDPGAKVIGPNFEKYNATAYDAFFSFAKKNGCVPDITSWHDLVDGPVHYSSDYESYRSIEAKYGITPREVFINEYGRQNGEMGRPGRLIQYLARFEKTKVFGGLSYWDAAGRLSDLSSTDGRPNGAWYLYQWYGQATGNTADVALPDQNGNLQAMAFTSAPNTVQVIFGGSGNDSDVFDLKVVVADLTGASVHYEVRETSYTALDYQAPPGIKASGSASLVSGQATVTVTGCKALSAYEVLITP